MISNANTSGELADADAIISSDNLRALDRSIGALRRAIFLTSKTIASLDEHAERRVAPDGRGVIVVSVRHYREAVRKVCGDDSSAAEIFLRAIDQIE